MRPDARLILDPTLATKGPEIPAAVQLVHDPDVQISVGRIRFVSRPYGYLWLIGLTRGSHRYVGHPGVIASTCSNQEGSPLQTDWSRFHDDRPNQI